MTTDQESSGLEKWREDFYTLAMKDKIDLPDYEFAERYYIAAKISSYELKENLRKRGNNLSKECVELQKEIEELKSLINYITPYVKENVGNEFMSNRLKEWLEKAEKVKA